jgi:hypothetical protein
MLKIRILILSRTEQMTLNNTEIRKMDLTRLPLEFILTKYSLGSNCTLHQAQVSTKKS